MYLIHENRKCIRFNNLNKKTMAMIKLTGINKIYVKNEIETLALENVNLGCRQRKLSALWVPPVVASLPC